MRLVSGLLCLTSVAAVDSGYVAGAIVPAGWPLPATNGVLVRDHLPGVRAAQSNGFWPLFLHISQARIPMTAPVAMDLPGRPLIGMRFLYPDAITPAGATSSAVRVVDLPAVEVLRVSWRGLPTADLVDATLVALRAEAQARGLSAAGEPMLFGYNGRSTPVRKRTWELALPITPATAPAAR